MPDSPTSPPPTTIPPTTIPLTELNNNMSTLYTFATTLLSAEKFFPVMTSQSLSASGVNTISLSTNDVGIAFNPKTPIGGTLVNVTVQGSVFKVDRVYHLEKMALAKKDGDYTIFQVLTTGTVGVGLSANYRSVSNSETRRKRHLGY